MESPVEFMWYDYTLFAVVLVASTAIGLYFAIAGDRQRSTREYLSADRSLGILPALLSIYMSQTSGVSVVGHPAEMYTYGVQAIWILLGNSLGFVFAAIVFVPLFFPLKLISGFEYIQMRFRSRLLHQVASVITLIGGIQYMAICLFTPAIALVSVTPIPLWASYIAMGVIGTVYTSLGGLKAVVWSDVFQAVVTICGLVAICVLAVGSVGSFSDVWEINQEGGRMNTSYDFSPITRLSFWSVVVGNFALALFVTGIHPSTVQRVCAMKSLTDAYVATLGIIPIQFALYVLVFTCGGAAFAYYDTIGCDPLRTGDIMNVNQILPYFISHGIRKPLLPGLFVAILFSAGISSVTSTMNSMAGMTWADFMADREVFKRLKEHTRANIIKVIAFIYGCAAVGMAFAYEYIPGNAVVVVQAVNTATISPTLGLFLLGALFPCANWIGGLVGLVFGFLFNATLGVGNSLYAPYAMSLNSSVHGCPDNVTVFDEPILGNEDKTPVLFRMSHTYYAGIGTMTTITLGLLVSLLTDIPFIAVRRKPLQYFSRGFEI